MKTFENLFYFQLGQNLKIYKVKNRFVHMLQNLFKEYICVC